MNTIRNQKALKARLSASWPHDSSHYRFARTHKGPAFETSRKAHGGEFIAWALVLAFLLAFCFFVLGLV